MPGSGDPPDAWTIFVTSVGIPVPPEMMVATEPQQIADDRRWFLHEMAATTSWVPDVDALFPGGHTGFADDPAAFEEPLRRLL